MNIVRYSNLPNTNTCVYNLTIRFRREYLWPTDGSTASEYQEDDGRMIFYLAMETVNNRICGMVGYDPSNNRLRQLIIHPEFQGKRIGSQLVENVEREALSFQNKILKVCAWKESVPYYSKKGFNIVGQPYLSKGIFCQKMEKNLTTRKLL